MSSLIWMYHHMKGEQPVTIKDVNGLSFFLWLVILKNYTSNFTWESESLAKHWCLPVVGLYSWSLDYNSRFVAAGGTKTVLRTVVAVGDNHIVVVVEDHCKYNYYSCCCKTFLFSTTKRQNSPILVISIRFVTVGIKNKKK